LIRYLAVFIILILPLVTGQTFSQVEILVPAVSQDPYTEQMFGIPVRLDIKMIEPGTGEIFVNTRSLTEMDMQGSARLAAMVAGQITGREIDELDFLITLNTNSTIIGGPSAGAAMTVAISALLEGLEIRQDVMMTGMITLDGAIGVVGGIPEKAQAAYRAGAGYFLVPEGQSVSYNSTTYEDVNVTELAMERWNLSVVEVSDVREAITWFTGLEFPSREYPATPVALEPYQNLMRSQSEEEIALANTSLNAARGLFGEMKQNLSEDIAALLEDDLNFSAGRLQEARQAYDGSRYYVASSKAFQSRIFTRTIANTVRFYSSNESDRDGVMEDIWDEADDAVADAEIWVNGTDVRGITGLEAHALAQSRIVEARARIEESVNYYGMDQVDLAIFEASYAVERAFTARQWADTSRFFGEGPVPGEDDLRAIAEGLYADASILATYADMLYEEVFGLPIYWVISLIPDYDFIDPYPFLDSAAEGIENGMWAMATFEALESEVRSGLAIEFINVLVLAEDLEEAAEMMEAIAEEARHRARISIEDSREIGIEPIIAVSRFEFSEDLMIDGGISALGEAVSGFRYAMATARISPSLLDLYRPRLEVDELEGSYLVGEFVISGTAHDPNGDALELVVTLGDFERDLVLLPGEFSAEIPTGSMPDGEYLLELNLSDGTLTDFYSASVFIDNNPPVIIVGNVINNTAYGEPLVPNITMGDIITANLTLRMELDGSPYISGECIGYGKHLLTVLASDEAGWSEELRLVFWVDTDLPQIDIKLPSDNRTYLKPPVNALWVAHDDLTRISDAAWRLDSGNWVPAQEVNSSWNDAGWTTWFRTGGGIPEGDHTLQILVSDMAGNSAELSITFVVDGTPPQVTLLGIGPGLWYGEPVKPGYTLDDAGPITQITALLDGVPHDGSTVSEQGMHEYTITAIDAAGNEVTLGAKFIIDLDPPLVSANITDGAAYPREVSISVSSDDVLDDEPMVESTLDGNPYGGGKIPPGPHVFEARVVDDAGNVNTLAASFAVDLEAPVMDLSVANGTWYAEPVEVVASVRDGIDPSPGLRLTLDGSAFESGGTTADGKHVLVAEAWDWAGNTVVLEVTFYVDSEAPGLSLVGVENDGVYSYSIIPGVTVTDSVDGNPVITMELDGSKYSPGEPIGDGSHKLFVTAIDLAGNTRRMVIDFVVDTVPPGLELDIVDGAEYRGSIIPSISSTDDRGNTTLSASLDGQPYYIGEKIGPGSHTLIVEATDSAGNTMRRKVIFTVKRRTISIIVLFVLVSIPILFVLGYVLVGRLRMRSRAYRYDSG